MPQLSKEKGISFNRFSVDNEKGYFLVDVQKPIKPKQSYTAQYLPGRSETVYGSGGYQDILVNVVIGIRYADVEDRTYKINAITKAWCFVESELRLKHNAFYYVGKVLDEVAQDEDGRYTLLTFPFICKPFMYSNEKQVTLANTTAIDYQGDYKCEPILKFRGTGTHVITCNGESFTIVVNNRNITVDCSKGIVYYDDITNAMEYFTGDFINFNPESINTITWQGTEGSTAPILHYKDVNLCKIRHTEKSY